MRSAACVKVATEDDPSSGHGMVLVVWLLDRGLESGLLWRA